MRMLFNMFLPEGIELSFMVKSNLIPDDEGRQCSHTGFILSIREISRSEDGSAELKGMFEQKHIMPEFLFGRQNHRNHVKDLLLRSEIWPQDVEVDLESILDRAFSQSISKLEIDRVMLGPTVTRSIIPTITFEVIKFYEKDEDDDDDDDDDGDVAVEQWLQLVQQSMAEAPNTTAATKESIKKLKKVKLEKRNSAEQCTICMEQLVSDEESETIISMPCSHLFHGSCIRQWLNTSHQCPLCRFPMPTYDACSCHPHPADSN